jgi:four helix bundle protein
VRVRVRGRSGAAGSWVVEREDEVGASRHSGAGAAHAYSCMAYAPLRMQEAAEKLVAEIDRLLPVARRRAAKQADHLERSADSVMFNLAEGVACYKPKMKTSAYAIARKEANEVRAVLRRLVIKEVFRPEEVQQGIELAGACVGMLTNAIRSVEERALRER